MNYISITTIMFCSPQRCVCMCCVCGERTEAQYLFALIQMNWYQRQSTCILITVNMLLLSTAIFLKEKLLSFNQFVDAWKWFWNVFAYGLACKWNVYNNFYWQDNYCCGRHGNLFTTALSFIPYTTLLGSFNSMHRVSTLKWTVS